MARNGHVNNEYWIDVRNYFIVYIKDLLDRYYTNYPDSKSFEDEKEVILQYLAFFDKYLA